MSQQEQQPEFVAEYAFTETDEFASAPIPRLAGDEAFYDEMNRVLGNLKLIRKAHPSCGTLVSYVTNADGDRFKITLK